MGEALERLRFKVHAGTARRIHGCAKHGFEQRWLQPIRIVSGVKGGGETPQDALAGSKHASRVGHRHGFCGGTFRLCRTAITIDASSPPARR